MRNRLWFVVALATIISFGLGAVVARQMHGTQRVCPTCNGLGYVSTEER